MKRAVFAAAVIAVTAAVSGCGSREPLPGEVSGFEQGEKYLSIWVHTIEDTPEGEAYKEAVNNFNAEYNGRYFADADC